MDAAKKNKLSMDAQITVYLKKEIVSWFMEGLVLFLHKLKMQKKLMICQWDFLIT